MTRSIKPPELQAGDSVGIVAPAGPVDPERLEKGVRELESLGYRVVLGDGVLSRHGFFAGEHEQRAESFLSMLANPGIQAIICARGGYGSNYVAEYLSSPKVLRRLQRLPPRIVMGYSDISTLLLFLHQRLGWITFQGPMAAWEFAGGKAAYNGAVLDQVLCNSASGAKIDTDAVSLRKGVAEGKLTGGCLSLLVATLGTPEEIDTRGSILLLEDIAERPYRVDRLLFQLRRAGKFRGIKAAVFGEMPGCEGKEPGSGSEPANDGGVGTSSDIVRDVIRDALDGFDVPVVFGMRFGHTTGGCLTLPLGVRARLSAREKVRLTLLEPAVSGRPAPVPGKQRRMVRPAGSVINRRRIGE